MDGWPLSQDPTRSTTECRVLALTGLHIKGLQIGFGVVPDVGLAYLPLTSRRIEQFRITMNISIYPTFAMWEATTTFQIVIGYGCALFAGVTVFSAWPFLIQLDFKLEILMVSNGQLKLIDVDGYMHMGMILWELVILTPIQMSEVDFQCN